MTPYMCGIHGNVVKAGCWRCANVAARQAQYELMRAEHCLHHHYPPHKNPLVCRLINLGKLRGVKNGPCPTDYRECPLSVDLPDKGAE